MGIVLEVELETYNNKKDELLKESENQFVLVKGTEIVGTFEAQGDALQEGYRKFGKKPFLVKQILQVEPPLNFTSHLIEI